MLAAGVVALAAGTYAFRWAGPALRDRVRLPARVVRLLEIGAVVLLTALVAVTTLPLGTADLGFAVPAGVLAGGLVAWFRQPILLVILAAAATTAFIRLLGVA
ncbi:AzlD domain-containing protein [Nocardia implantans]|uniref:AzlD domain-containing protein n=1 Tax=Nocardia implantans TaxID=3108168 RepID=A0ABU6APL1_9NOCA|nr:MULTISPECIES: AzlD domain-containing protein [unclassified Nocardia]MBF6189748.1 AzlD domain-containing protein [Nocardia beijingensis]MEA3527021.1 AzlD domain-containing protein [Nocardia sp. CDC192]MEB3509401.1 AzlD domain-containing protein [Nocardia sp. CDC186]